MRIGRNEACPCGSGKKFKTCCEGKATRGIPKGLIVLLAVLAVIAALAFVPRGDNSSTSTASLPGAPRAAASKPGPQPGPAPPGKVWSTEHGHWHDIAPRGTAPASAIKVEQTSGNSSRVPLTPTVGGTPQPAGPVPPGKVWSTEHGHWHDATPAASK